MLGMGERCASPFPVYNRAKLSTIRLSSVRGRGRAFWTRMREKAREDERGEALSRNRVRQGRHLVKSELLND